MVINQKCLHNICKILFAINDLFNLFSIYCVHIIKLKALVDKIWLFLMKHLHGMLFHQGTIIFAFLLQHYNVGMLEFEKNLNSYYSRPRKKLKKDVICLCLFVCFASWWTSKGRNCIDIEYTCSYDILVYIMDRNTYLNINIFVVHHYWYTQREECVSVRIIKTLYKRC